MTPPITEAQIETLVRRFYAKATGDPVIGPVFAAAVDDWEAHYARLRAFWTSVLLGGGGYKGNPFGVHLALGLQPAQFDAWLGLWRETTAELFAPDLARLINDKAARIGDSLRQGLLFRAADAPA
jgi:hemoglobin